MECQFGLGLPQDRVEVENNEKSDDEHTIKDTAPFSNVY